VHKREVLRNASTCLGQDTTLTSLEFGEHAIQLSQVDLSGAIVQRSQVVNDAATDAWSRTLRTAPVRSNASMASGGRAASDHLGRYPMEHTSPTRA